MIIFGSHTLPAGGRCCRCCCWMLATVRGSSPVRVQLSALLHCFSAPEIRSANYFFFSLKLKGFHVSHSHFPLSEYPGHLSAENLFKPSYTCTFSASPFTQPQFGLPGANWAAGAAINKDKLQHSVSPIVFPWLAFRPIRANANAANAAVSSLGAQTVEVHG